MLTIQSSIDRAALTVRRCELLFLDGRLDEASQLFDSELSEHLAKLAPDDAAPIADNRSMLAFEALELSELDWHYHQADIRRLLGIELRDYGAALQATSDSAAGNHHRSLPGHWRLLQDAYRSLNWRTMQWAHSQMARECLTLAWPHEAVWHATQALNRELLQSMATGLAASRSVDKLRSSIARSLKYSALAQHAMHTSTALREIADVIPDDQVAQVVEWVRPRLQAAPTDPFGVRLAEAPWRLIETLSTRLKPQDAYNIAKIAAAHSSVPQRGLLRAHVLKAWNALLRVVPQHRVAEFLDPALRLITTEKHDFDYVDSLNLVCCLGSRDPSVAEQLRARLFAPGTSTTDAYLVQAGAIIGWRPKASDALDTNARTAAAAVRKQVEIVPEGGEPAKIGAAIKFTQTLESGTLIVHVGGAVGLIDAVVAHLPVFGDRVLDELALAMLEMVVDDRNVVNNRITLVAILGKLVPRLRGAVSAKTLTVLVSLANGEFEEPSSMPSYQVATNTLMSVRIPMGDPRTLRGEALLAIAMGCAERPDWASLLHDGLLARFLESADEELRKYGVVAAAKAGRLTESESVGVLAAGLDESSEVRAAALHSMAVEQALELSGPTVWLAVRAVDRASRSPSAAERRLAGKATLELKRRLPGDHDARERLSEVLERLRGDANWSVRRAASESIPV